MNSKDFIIENIILSDTINFIFKKALENKFWVPCYHFVTSKAPPAYVKHLYPITTVGKFERDLDMLLTIYNPIEVDELLESVENGIIPKKRFLLTFDDGYRVCSDTISSILIKKGIPAIFFIIGEFIDNKILPYFNKASLIIEAMKKTKKNTTLIKKLLINESLWNNDNIYDSIKYLKEHNTSVIDKIGTLLGLNFMEILNKEKPFMTKEQVLDLKNCGFSIGWHSTTHKHFNTLPFKDQIKELQIWNKLKKFYNEDKFYFAFPFGSTDVKIDFYRATRDMTDLIFDTLFSKFNHKGRTIQRFIMDSSLPVNKVLLLTLLLKLKFSVKHGN